MLYNELIRLFREYDEYLEEEDEVLFFSGHSYTYGVHSFGDSKEISAEDPYNKLDIEDGFTNMKELQKFIDENNITIAMVKFRKYEWGSYHERDVNVGCTLDLLIPEEILSDWYEFIRENENDEKMSYGVKDDNDYRIKRYTIENPPQNLTKIKKLFNEWVFDFKPPVSRPKSGEERDDYMTRMMRNAKANSFRKNSNVSGD